MSKTKDTSNVDLRTLMDTELDAVTGGGLVSAVANVAASAAKAASQDMYPDWSNRPPCGIFGPLSPWGDPIHPC